MFYNNFFSLTACDKLFNPISYKDYGIQLFCPRVPLK